LFFENRALFQIMWKNVVEPGRPQTTMWHMLMACLLSKATNRHSECVTHIALPLHQWLLKRTSALRYTYFACIV